MSVRKKWRATTHLVIGFFALALLVGVLGVWSVQARISGAVIASGLVAVESNRQVIQHPQGGVVGEILAKDGDLVAAGDVVLRLDSTSLNSELAIIEGQLFELLARKARLEAERDGRDEFALSPLLKVATNLRPEVQDLVEGQSRLFMARAESLTKEDEQLIEQTAQIEEQIVGNEAQLKALRTQRRLIEEELVNSEELLAKRLIQSSRVLDLRREAAQVQGDIARLTSEIARLRGQISGIAVQRLQLETSRREGAITTLRDLQYNEIELSERRLAARETLSRLEIKAPVAGVIYGSSVFALQSVVQPAAPLMYVIPQDTPLVVNARVEAINIDQVHIGQEVSLRFAAFDQRQTPELLGRVTNLSADVFIDEASGVSYYQAELAPNPDELIKLGAQTLLPGMPVEAFIKTEERSPLSYLAKPLTDYFERAFRDG